MAHRVKRNKERKEEKRMEKEAKRWREIQEATMYNMGPIMFENAAINIENGLRHEKGRDFFSEDYWKGEGRGAKHKDVTAVIVAGGPSLEVFGHLDTLKKHYKDRRFTIIAVDRAFPKLVRKGIMPDYVFSADAQAATADFYDVATMKSYREKLKRAGTMAVFPGWIHPDVWLKWTLERRCFFWPSAPFGKYLEVSDMWNSMVPLGVVNVHAHVTGAALSFVAELGLKSVCLIGADYCYEAGVEYEETEWYKFLADQGVEKEDIYKELDPQLYKDPLTEENIVSDVIFMSYVGYILGWLDALEPPMKVFNCSQRGLLYDPQGGRLIKHANFDQFLGVVEKWSESSEE